MLEIKGEYDKDRKAFTLFLKKENNEIYYIAFSQDCFKDEYSTYQTLNGAFFELLHKAFPEEIKREFEEMKRITGEIHNEANTI